MHLRKLRTVMPVFAVIFLLVGFVAGCGGGGNQSKPQGDAPSKEQKASKKEETGKKGAGMEAKIALGKVRIVKAENKRFTLAPSTDKQGKKPIAFKVIPDAKITLDGKELKLADVKKGQQAKVEYVVREKLGVPNRARAVTLFSKDKGGAKGGETTG